MSRDGLIFIHPSDELYGADRVVLELVSALPSGLRAEVWVPTDLTHPDLALCTQLRARGVLVRHIDLPILRRANRSVRGVSVLIGRTVRLVIRLARARPQVVYCTTSAALLSAPVARLVRVPHVIGHLQEVWTSSDRRLLVAPARACHQLVAASTAVTAALPRRLAARTVVVPNATVEPLAWQPVDRRSGPLRFVIASRWTPRKGYATLLAAWDRLDRPGHLTILGAPPRSGDAVDVAAMVAALRRPDTVTIAGEVADVGRYLDEADVALVPSDEPESFGLVAIEAFAHGRPVVAAAGGGLLEVITPGEDGWLFAPRDVDALTRLLGELTRAEVAEAGARARISYEKDFTVIAYQQRWGNAVRAVLGY